MAVHERAREIRAEHGSFAAVVGACGRCQGYLDHPQRLIGEALRANWRVRPATPSHGRSTAVDASKPSCAYLAGEDTCIVFGK